MNYRDLDEIYREKERVFGALETAVGPLTVPQLSFRPAPDAWGVAEIIEHLAIVEPGMIRLVRSLAEKADSHTGLAPVPFAVTLSGGIVTGATGKFKTRPEAVPTGKVPVRDSLRTLRHVQAELFDLRPRLVAVDVSSVKFTHRALGDMTLGQWCAFFGAHEERHLGQIRSVISAPGFPKQS
jgi:hypothetical protein